MRSPSSSRATGPDKPVYLDLLIEGVTERRCLVSGADWQVGSGRSLTKPGMSLHLTHAHVVRRPHPLVAAQWLTGTPEIRVDAIAFEAAADGRPIRHRFDVTVPAGTVGLVLPIEVATATLDGDPVAVVDGEIRLAEPLVAPTVLAVEVGERVFAGGGAAWRGPIQVQTASTPARLGSWHEHGLGSWSGAVRYERTIDVAERAAVELDLGRVRGAVTVAVDGQSVGAAFCAPFRFDLGMLAVGAHRIEVTVYGTLAPRLDSLSPTAFLRPSQLVTGILGPARTRTTA